MEDIIYCHPSVLNEINKYIESKTKEDHDNHIYKIFGYNVITDEFMEPYKWTGRYIRTNKYPDDRFFTWLTEAEIQDPPEWAIYMGLVEKEMEANLFIIEQYKLKKSFVYKPEYGRFK